MPVDTYPFVEELAIARFVGPLNLSRGRTAERAGAVVSLNWDAAHFRLSADVQGTAPEPYRSTVKLDLGMPGRATILAGACTCPVGRNCKHVAATLIASAERHKREQSEAADLDVRDAASAAASGWRGELAALAGTAHGSDGQADDAAVRQPLALQFELRERVSRKASARQTARDEPASSAASVDRLAVRPVTRGTRGGWIKGSLTWQNVGFQGRAGGFDPAQARWFAEFSLLKGTRHSAFAEYGSAWISLDEYESRTLWALLDAAPRLGIALVGGTARTVIDVARPAVIGLDARHAAAAPGDDPKSEPDTNAEPDADAAAGAVPGPDPDLVLTPAVTVGGRSYPTELVRLIGDHGVYAFDFAEGTITLAPLAAPLTAAGRAAVRRRTPIIVPAAEVETFVEEQYAPLARSLRLASGDGSFALPELPPATLVATMHHEPNHVVRLEWRWEADGGRRFALDAPDAEFHDPERERLVATSAAALLADDPAGLPAVTPGTEPRLRPEAELRGLASAEFTARLVPRLQELERLRIDVVGDPPAYRELVEAPTLTVTTVESDRTDWFDLGVVVTVEGRKVPFGPLFSALAKGRAKLLMVDGSYLSLKQPVFDPLRELIEEAGSLREWEAGLTISRYQTSLWAEFEDLADQSETAVAWRDTVAGLRAADGVEEIAPPAGLAMELRPYQLAGFRWLAFLHRHGLGGILADDMGLGKTAQTLALIAHAHETAAEGERRPFLVVAPTSVVSNWAAEATRFVPGLRVETVTATRASSGARLADVAARADIVVTSYAILRLDAPEFASLEWAGLVLDEAQFVKNHSSKANAAARDIRAPFRLAVTGTPVENNLMELWALLKIVAPGLFPSARGFAERFARPIENDHNAERLATLRRRIRPFMLRRTKDVVAPELPPKQEQVLTVQLDPEHQRVYDAFLQLERQKLLGLIDDLDRNRFTVFRSLTLLRMLSLHAALIDAEQYADVPSAKLDALFDQLDEVVAEGHRALVFSQFTSFLQIAAARLEAAGVPYAYLDGATTKRADVIAKFREGDAPVFLISLKAGGFGLNLTEADYVFLLDPWWNPASEAQAVDRAHRIGQSKSVNVYRMVAEGTIEEKVMALKARKAKLVSSLMDDGELFSETLTADDIRGLLGG
ncbi:DEAD/DEAH box helicase [Agromyces cerinus]|uniref:Helicase conserved C-terminal domain-containing protein n=1 Tax=Agromyces cerinus subsp. cerinus TaxID=232089 RepID=A0A1N6I150_9MICO|nr:DEAD/DEAH box helicase [Agromyces cerinus]SIO25772.1 Helicase conserved C-terminal domain-containing protein [Agromyces cerinus subsp. cerinus]